MKNIFLLLVLFFSVAIGYSQQYPVNQTLGAPTTLVTSRGGFKADSSFILPAYSDTNKANANPYVKNYAGSLIKVGNTIYVRSTDLSQWILVGSGGGTTPTLQQVTDVGSTTTNIITVGDVIQSVKMQSNSFVVEDAGYKGEYNGNGFTSTGKFYNKFFRIQGFNSNNFNNQTLLIPQTGGVLTTRVNGTLADSSGNIIINTGSGTVTSIATGYGLSGGTITNTGTLLVDSATLSNKYLRIVDTANKFVNRLSRTLGKDSIIYFVGENRFAIKDSVGSNPAPVGYYGAFQDVTNQTATVINTGYPMKLGVTDLSNGVTVVSNSRITIANTGIYNIQWSGQFTNPLSAEHDVTVWLRKNGVDVPGSAGVVLVPKKHGTFDGHTLPAWNYLIDPVAGDYYEFVWSTANTSVYLSFTGAGSPPPSAASVIVTVTQQSGIMAGTGITAINSLTGASQTIVAGTSGNDFAVSSTGTTHTLNLPTASATNRGALSSANWTTFNSKLGASDTVSLSNRINLKLNVSDTASMLSPYAKSDLVATKLNSSDTASLSSRINLKLNSTDTASLSSRINQKQTDLDLLQSLSLGFKAEPYGCTYANVTSQLTLLSPRLYFYPFNWNVSDSIRGIAFLNRSTATLTSTNYNGVAIYSLSGGTLTRLTFTANSGTFWDGTGNTWKTNAITPYYLPKGVYYLGYEASGSAGLPTIASGTIMQTGFIEPPSAVNANGIKISSFISNATTIPPSSVAFSTTTTLQQIPYFILY